MEYYFDTSSLVALARYYHPFDKDGRTGRLALQRHPYREWCGTRTLALLL